MGFVSLIKRTRNATAAMGVGAVVALGAVLAPAPSQAAVVIGAFDPAFGPFLPNLGYRGLVSVFVPDLCFANVGIVSNSDICSSGAMVVQSVSLELYNVNTPGQPSLYVNISTALPGAVFNVEIAFDNSTNRNELMGLDTDFSGDFGVSLNDGLGVNFSNINFYFGFDAALGGPGAGPAVLLACAAPLVDCSALKSEPGEQATTVFGTRDGGAPRQVPEPAAAWLSLLALGMAAAATRRRKNQT